MQGSKLQPSRGALGSCSLVWLTMEHPHLITLQTPFLIYIISQQMHYQAGAVLPSHMNKATDKDIELTREAVSMVTVFTPTKV